MSRVIQTDATEEDIKRVKQEKVIRGVCQMCNKLKTTDITYDQAVAMWDILVNNAQKKENSND